MQTSSVVFFGLVVFFAFWGISKWYYANQKHDEEYRRARLANDENKAE